MCSTACRCPALPGLGHALQRGPVMARPRPCRPASSRSSSTAPSSGANLGLSQPLWRRGSGAWMAACHWPDAVGHRHPEGALLRHPHPLVGPDGHARPADRGLDGQRWPGPQPGAHQHPGRHQPQHLRHPAQRQPAAGDWRGLLAEQPCGDPTHRRPCSCRPPCSSRPVAPAPCGLPVAGGLGRPGRDP